MAIIKMSKILKKARQNKYAVGCYNVINLDMIRGILKAAEEEQSPVILCHAEIHFKYTPLEVIAPIMLREAERAKVPVALLLDHGKSFEGIMKAMHAGFNAVMFDGSNLDYQTNVLKTKEIVKIARTLDVEVEAELGHVSRPESGGAEGDEDDSVIDDTSLYTDPEQARQFINETGADALAVAFGTAHGLYLKTPKLDLDRLQKIYEAVPTPLVMHGGSGLSEENYSESIKRGISKINYYTCMALCVADKLGKELTSSTSPVFYHNLMLSSIDAFSTEVQKTMRMFGSSGQAR